MVHYICMGYNKKIKSSKLKKLFKIQKKVSIVIPTYNEEGSIEKTVRAIKENMQKTPYKNDYEIVIVDDDSKDKTPLIIDNLAKKECVVAIHRYGKKGVFSAFLDGITASNGEYFITTGADYSAVMGVLPEMISHMDTSDIVSASRYGKGGGMNAPLLRKLGSFTINKICALIIGLKVNDITGVFHLMRKDKFFSINFRYPASFGEFDFEWLFRAVKLGYTIKEVPFRYQFREEGVSKMNNLLKSAYSYLRMALRLRREGRLKL